MSQASHRPGAPRWSRRSFLTHSAAAGAVAASAPWATLAARPRAGGANDAVGVGVIGAGIRGEILVRATQAVGGTRIVDVCDLYDGHLDKARELTGGAARVQKDYQRVLENRDVDAVLIVTPDHWHSQMALEAMAAGKDVFIEKPMTHRWEEGPAIIEAAARHDRIAQVGSQYESMPANARAIELIRSGALGQVTMISGHIHRNTAAGAWYYPIPPDASPATVDWRRFVGPAPWHEFDPARFFQWRLFWDYSGGLPTDLFVHLITATHTLMDVRMPSRVVGIGGIYRWKGREVPDQMSAIVEYDEGFTLTLSATANNAHSLPLLRIMGTEGTLEYFGNRLVLHREPVIENYTYATNRWTDELKRSYAERHDLDPATMRPRATAALTKPAPEAIETPGPDSTEEHLRRFYDSVRTRRQPTQDARMGHQCATVGHMVNLSHRQQAEARWDTASQRVVVGASTA
jgi:predicted dehydrogenase